MDAVQITDLHHRFTETQVPEKNVILDIVNAMSRHWSEPGHVCWDKCPCHTKKVVVCEK